eukprot:TRINITY_DN24137_c0_g3_i1.p1 TRINITY_DN24137_c0_g3~~TRINITY_DN24137_c0_g3_i1.p1  ORF type:complete len:1272 (-),score=188.79 TRINITY_DN24137_c0_g3_i1:259-3585(-)
MAAPKSHVLRNGQTVQVESSTLVVGDVVVIKMGDVVPADMLVLEAVDLKANEAMLTGEPTDISKSTVAKDPSASFLSNMLYSGTSVVSGHGKAEVLDTGMRTQVGLIAKRLGAERSVTAKNPLAASVNKLGTALAICLVVVILLAATIAFQTGYQDPARPCDAGDRACFFKNSFLRAVIMAVALIPHGIPIVCTVMLRVGAMEMAKLNGLTMKMSAVDYLSATTVICTDKTGTLTEGKMTGAALMGAVHDPSKGATAKLAESSLSFYPLKGLCPNGGLFSDLNMTEEHRKQMDKIFDGKEVRQSFAQPGLPDLALPDDMTSHSNTLDAMMARAHLSCGFLTCYGTKLARDAKTGVWETTGNMTEGALKVAAAKGGYWDDEGAGHALHSTCVRLSDMEVPFTSDRKMMATVHALPENHRVESLQFASDYTHFAILKGAPDRLVDKLGSVLDVSDGALHLPGRSMNDVDRASVKKHNSHLAHQALRSILLALRPLSAADLDKMKACSSADDRLAVILGEPTKVVFLSLWGIYDPPRTSVPPSVKRCHEAGIQVVMITGDQPDTATAIGKKIGVICEGDDPDIRTALCSELHEPMCQRRVSGTGLWNSRRASETLKSLEQLQRGSKAGYGGKHRGSKRLSVHDVRGRNDATEPEYRSEEVLAEITQRVRCFARAQPTDKVAIVESLKAQNNIVAMTGDGVNDAPALKSAHVGVSMGIAGTAVTHQASDLVLLDDNFSTIVSAIQEGRRIYNNAQKYVAANLSLKFGEMVSILISIGFGVVAPINPTPQLLNLLVTHIISTFCFAFEVAEPYIMKVPPRSLKDDFVISRTQILFRVVPFVIYFPAVVYASLCFGMLSQVGTADNHAIIGTSMVLDLASGKTICERAGWEREGEYKLDARPFHCRCKVSKGGMPSGDIDEFDQWGSGHMEVSGNPIINKDMFSLSRSVWKGEANRFVEPCKGNRDMWCWRDDVEEFSRPVLPSGISCGEYGVKYGQSMALFTIMTGEMLSLMSFRTDGFFIYHLFQNKFYLLTLACQLFITFQIIFNPSLSSLLDVVALERIHLAAAGTFALCLVVLNELAKVLFRVRLAALNQELEKQALALSHSEVKSVEV